MKRILITAAAVLAFLPLRAQDWMQVRDLYRAGQYAETVSRLRDVEGQMADGYRALCALQMHTDNAYDIADAYIENWPDGVLLPQVSFL